jgi:hypothetical protein
MNLNTEKIKELRGFQLEQCRFLALRIPALNMLKTEYRLTHNEITILAVIYFLTRSAKGFRVYKQQLKNFLGNWQRAYLHRKLKSLEGREFIWSREILGIRYYILSTEGERVITQFNKLMILAYEEYLQSKKPKKAI